MRLAEELLPLPKRIEREGGLFRAPKALPFVLEGESDRVSGAVSALAEENGLKARRVDAGRDAVLRLALRGTVRELRGVAGALAEEGYALRVLKSGVQLSAPSERGLFYGLQTLRQLMAAGEGVPCVHIVDWPDMPFRGVHMTLGGGGFTFEVLARTIRQLAACKMNAVVFEYDDKFPWESHPAVAHPDALTRREIRALIDLAAAHGMEVVPLLDSLGHAICYLKHDAYRHLRELPDNVHEMCPNNPKTLAFIKELWAEILDVHREARYAHITGDEVFRLGDFCPKCRAWERRGELAKLFTTYYTDLSRWIIRRGKIPMVWGDMLVKLPQDLANFPRDIVINDWCYWGSHDSDRWPATIGNYGRFTHETLKRLDKATLRMFRRYWIQKSTAPDFTPFPNLKFFKDQGFDVIGCAAASESAAAFPFPSPVRRYVNAKRFSATIAQQGAMGFLNTFWGAASSFESAWYGLCAGADFSWHARQEAPALFGRRFARVFLDAPAAQGNTVRWVDGLLYPEPRGFYRAKTTRSGRIKRGTYGSAAGTSNRSARGGEAGPPLAALTRAARRHRPYAHILDVAARMGALNARVWALTDRTAERVMGGGPARPISLAAYANTDFHGCTPPKAAPLAVPPGRHCVYGVPFDVIDPAANGGKSVLSFTGLENPDGLPSVSIDPGRGGIGALYFLWTSFLTPPNSYIADVHVRYEDGRVETLPVVTGANLADWWAKPAPTTDAFVAWHGGHDANVDVYCYVAWWVNPRPDRAVGSIEIVSTEHDGHLNLLALTARRAPARKPDPRDAAELRRELKRLERELARIPAAARRAYEKVLTAQDAESAAKRVPVSTLRKWCAICARHLAVAGR
ncbi:MAG: beta-N-acetylhexosaminidase [Kiritimatiellae bacterium]|nr:beta-N-acetylhexosaminidase [Kiritimatiellia bacterium]